MCLKAWVFIQSQVITCRIEQIYHLSPNRHTQCCVMFMTNVLMGNTNAETTTVNKLINLLIKIMLLNIIAIILLSSLY